MSKYTTEVRYICEMNSGFPVDEMNKHTPDDIITASRAKIFNFSYPIYEETHRPELETKILKHYYTREIGAETVNLWKLWLNERLNLIMPKYNKLYQFEHETLGKELYNIDVDSHSLREDDFTDDSDHTRTDNLKTTSDHTRTDNLQTASDHTRTDNLANSNSETKTDNLTKTIQGTRGTTDKFSDTPQGTVANVDNGTYLTDYRKIDETYGSTETNTGTVGTVGSGTNTGTQRNAGTDNYTGTQRNAGTDDYTGTQRNAGTDHNYGDQELNGWERGYRGSKIYAELLSDYEEKVLNIDKLIVDELADLFMLVW